jgi:hypothetical protein
MLTTRDVLFYSVLMFSIFRSVLIYSLCSVFFFVFSVQYSCSLFCSISSVQYSSFSTFPSFVLSISLHFLFLV